jgi:hypothetical protein
MYFSYALCQIWNVSKSICMYLILIKLEAKTNDDRFHEACRRDTHQHVNKLAGLN